jgi:hypothetical protein
VPVIYYIGVAASVGPDKHIWYTSAQVSTSGDYTISTTSSSQSKKAVLEGDGRSFEAIAQERAVVPA